MSAFITFYIVFTYIKMTEVLLRFIRLSIVYIITTIIVIVIMYASMIFEFYRSKTSQKLVMGEIYFCMPQFFPIGFS